MRRSRVPAALAVVAVMAAGPVDTCRTGPNDPAGARLEFAMTGTLQAGEGVTPRVHSVSSGQVVLRGGLGTPTPCYTVDGSLDQHESWLRLTLVATARPGVCIQVLGALAYRARIYGLGAGHYTIEVLPTYPGTGWSPGADTLEVDVP